ncbi:uncharacterized protein LOC110716044 [Chenopodium quinoa]|uniref:uncharacterized protein LOC110716044 n=1 Tax=Chenopodium quinoa TaxID=63459 RepID=UPI000B78E07C|nr:uncharacterized protein LOC110716044 [Chenopodium quinoa]XP_021750372.1 uncharacterized protein LOC110716044 [Chenopodium quinoa]
MPVCIIFGLLEIMRFGKKAIIIPLKLCKEICIEVVGTVQQLIDNSWRRNHYKWLQLLKNSIPVGCAGLGSSRGCLLLAASIQLGCCEGLLLCVAVPRLCAVGLCCSVVLSWPVLLGWAVFWCSAVCCCAAAG